MTHRERVRLAFAHQEPDCVPIYEQTVCVRVASALLGRKMRTGGGQIRFEETAARWESEEAWQDYVGRLLEDMGDLVRELDFALVGMPWRHAAKPSAKLDDHTFRYGEEDGDWWSIYHYDEATDVFDEVDSVIDREGLPAIERQVAAMERGMADLQPPSLESYAPVQAIAARAGGERALKSGEGFISIPTNAAWLEACALRPDLIERYLDCSVAGARVAIPVAAQAGVQVLWAGGDMASSKGPLYSPAMFRRFLLPRLQRITEAAHAHGLVYVFRTDGNVWSIAEDLFVRSGIDGYGEVDIEAGMGLPELKQRHPHLTLWGGVSCGHLLTFGAPQQIREEVQRVMEACAPGGGLIFGSSNSIHAGIPPASYAAMLEAAREFGGYERG